MSIVSISDEYYDTIENQEPITPALSKFNLMLSVGVACPSFFPEYRFPRLKKYFKSNLMLSAGWP